jgi:heptosyltransferase-1
MRPRILIIKLSSMGDVIHALPVAHALRSRFPNAQLAWAIERRWLPLVEGNPALDCVLPIDTFRARARLSNLPAFARELQQIRAFRPDFALDLQGTSKSASICRLSGAPVRVGFGPPLLRERIAGFAYNRRVNSSATHVVEQLLAFAAFFGEPVTVGSEPAPAPADGSPASPLAPVPPAAAPPVRFDLPLHEAIQDDTDHWLRENNIGRFAFFSPGGGWLSKRWPEERYAELAAGLQARHGLHVVVNVGPGDRLLPRALGAAGARVSQFSGDLPHLIALLRRAALAVGGDTGPLHLAAALGRPAVAIYGPTDPSRNGPYGANHIVIGGAAAASGRNGSHAGSYRRSNRYSASMLAISVEEAAEGCGRVLQALAETAPAGAGTQQPKTPD